MAGQDASTQFHHFHSPQVLKQIASEFKVGELRAQQKQAQDQIDNKTKAKTASQTPQKNREKSGLHSVHNANLPTDKSQTFEIVIVGAGSAGCLLAKRLANAGLKVALKLTVTLTLTMALTLTLILTRP